VWFLANVRYAVARPSVVCLSSVCRLSSVTFVHPTQPVEIFGNVSTLFLPWPSVDINEKFYGDRSRGTPPSGELNAREVAKYSDFGLSKAISRKQCRIGGKLVLITNRKSYMSFRLIPKSVTLDDLERRSGPYFALFHRIRVRCRRKKFTFPISPLDEFLVEICERTDTHTCRHAQYFAPLYRGRSKNVVSVHNASRDLCSIV